MKKVNYENDLEEAIRSIMEYTLINSHDDFQDEMAELQEDGEIEKIPNTPYANALLVMKFLQKENRLGKENLNIIVPENEDAYPQRDKALKLV